VYKNVLLDHVGKGLELIAKSKNIDLGITSRSYSTAMWLAALPTAFLIMAHKNNMRGKFSSETEKEMISKIHWQMGHALQEQSYCVISPWKKQEKEKERDAKVFTKI
jgi:hypothetical protein